MKISIIIPIYNVEEYLPRCLESVISQTYKNIEIILVDDGSTDNCGKICDEYAQKDNRIVVIHKENEGVSEARNSGMDVMTGEYVFFIDSDDFIVKDAIATLVKRAEETSSDIIIGNYKIVNQEGEEKYRELFQLTRLEGDTLKNSAEKYKYFFGKSYGRNVWNKLYKSKFLNKINVFFDKDLSSSEDFLFNLKVFVNMPSIELVNEYTYCYFINNKSITNSYKINLSKNSLHFIENFYNYLNEKDALIENKDLIAYSSFTMIDNCCYNSFLFENNIFNNIKEELHKFKVSKIICNGIKDLSNGKYLKEVPRRDWKYYSRLFSILYDMNLLNLLTLIQIIRYKLTKK